MDTNTHIPPLWVVLVVQIYSLLISYDQHYQQPILKHQYIQNNFSNMIAMTFDLQHPKYLISNCREIFLK